MNWKQLSHNLGFTSGMLAVCFIQIPEALQAEDQDCTVLRADSPSWPQAVPGFINYQPPLYNGPFFKGEMLSAPDGISQTPFTLRREFVLKAVPQFAYLQYTAKDGKV